MKKLYAQIWETCIVYTSDFAHLKIRKISYIGTVKRSKICRNNRGIVNPHACNVATHTHTHARTHARTHTHTHNVCITEIQKIGTLITIILYNQICKNLHPICKICYKCQISLKLAGFVK